MELYIYLCVQINALWLVHFEEEIVSVHRQEEGCIGSRDFQEMFSRGKFRESKLGRLEAVYGHSLVINPSLGMDCQYASHCRDRFPDTSLETLSTPPHLLLPKSCHILLVICQNMRHLIVLPSRKTALPIEVCLSPTFHCPKNATFYLSFVICHSMRLPQES